MKYKINDLVDCQDFEHDQKFVKAEHWKEACDELEDKSKTVLWLQAENAKLRECVEFYADQNSYKCLIEDHHVTVLVVNFDTEPPLNSSVRMVGGKRARQVLKELEKDS